MPPPPEPPPPPPAPAITPGTSAALPTTVRPGATARRSLRQASRGTSNLTIPISTGTSSTTPAAGASSTGSTNLSIGR
jgi:hypothetical protein